MGTILKRQGQAWLTEADQPSRGLLMSSKRCSKKLGLETSQATWSHLPVQSGFSLLKRNAFFMLPNYNTYILDLQIDPHRMLEALENIQREKVDFQIVNNNMRERSCLSTLFIQLQWAIVTASRSD
jgi:hypothetical protein